MRTPEDGPDTVAGLDRDALIERVRRLERINRALMDRVEKSLDEQENPFSLFQAATILEAQVLERTAELHRAMKELEDSNARLSHATDLADQANRAKSEFLANMSHEIRTPLNGVLGNTELLRTTPLDARQSRLVDRLEQSADSLRDLIDDILDFSKIEAGHVQLDDVDFDLVDVVEGTFDLIADRANEKGLEVTCRPNADVPPVVGGDPTRLRQVLTNLLGNALKFTSEGGVEVALQRERADPLTILIEVRDTGIGIHDSVLEHIFEAFRQADGSTTRRFGGTGLGLSICRGLVNLMGGELGVESEPGKGSRFWVRLPYRAVPCPRKTPLDGQHWVVVHGHERSASGISARIRRLGGVATCIVPGSGVVSGVARALSGNPGFVLIDSSVPNVCSVVRRIREAVGDEVRLVAARAVRDPEPPARCFDDEVAKPVRSVDLLRIGGPRVVAPRASEALGFRGHVLVVEDNEINQEVVMGALEHFGLTLDLAANGVEAVTAYQKAHYDVILMDCQMPEMDGFEATRGIRRIERERALPPVPIVALTGNTTSEDRDAALACGMDGFLSKPFQHKGLAAVLARWLPPRPADSDPDPVLPKEAS